MIQDSDVSGGEPATRGEITTTETAAERPPPPYRTTTGETEHEPQPSYQPLGVDVRPAPTRSWAFATTQGDTIEAPICVDLDAEFLHVRPSCFIHPGVVFDVRSAFTDDTTSRVQR